MENLFTKKMPLYFETEESQLILGDSFKILTKMELESVDMIFADPPYFLSNDGITCQGGKMVSVNKGSWDKLSESGTSVEEKHKFNRKWIKLCKKVLKSNGTIWISGTLHNIYSIGTIEHILLCSPRYMDGILVFTDIFLDNRFCHTAA